MVHDQEISLQEVASSNKPRVDVCEIMEHPDKHLFDALCAGQTSAQKELLIDRCGRMLSYLSIKYEYEDLVGVLLVHLQEDDWRRLKTWKGDSSLKTWIEQVAIRLCLRHLKGKQRFEPLDEKHMVDHRLEGCRFSHQDLLKALSLLRNDQERRLIVLHALNDMSIVDAAEALGISRGNADVVKHRAIRNMRKALGLEGGSQ